MDTFPGPALVCPAHFFCAACAPESVVGEREEKRWWLRNTLSSFDTDAHFMRCGPLLEAGAQADEPLLTSLRESAQAIIDAQSEWVQFWAAELPGR